MPTYRLHYFPESGKQLQARADAHALRPELRPRLDRFRRWHDANLAVLQRVAALPGWRSAYDLLPWKRLTDYAGKGV